jgi:hypothetical protein
MKLTRYEDTAPVDYMVLRDDGEWVPASEALELESALAQARALLGELKADTSLITSTRWWNRVHAFLAEVPQ